MQIGLFGGDVVGRGSLEEIRDDARQAAEEGFHAFWLPSIFGLDPLTALGAVATDAPGIELGVAVVPMQPRHPAALAQQAMSTHVISGGRLVLGVGLSHRIVIETMLGLSSARPVRLTREYLTVLTSLIRTGSVSFEGEMYRVNAMLAVEGASPFPVVLAALGPQMLEVAGSIADGTATWMCGLTTLRDHVIPTIASAADRAGRSEAPRIGAGVPVAVTDDPEAARQEAAATFATYGQLPSYRAMLDREGAEGPEDVAVIGGEEQVLEVLGAYAEVGVTDLVAVVYSADPQARERTRATLRRMI